MERSRVVRLMLLASLLLACSSERDTPHERDAPTADVADTADTAKDRDSTEGEDAPDPDAPVTITVTLDGLPVEGARVTQGGATTFTLTDADGRTTVQVDHRVRGEVVFMASVPSARIQGAGWTPGRTALAIALTSYDPADNPAYHFQDPGEPTRRETTGQCAHCHVTLTEDWFASPHRGAASNPTLHDLYSGSAAAFDTPAACASAGGRWIAGGAGKVGGRCVLGASVLAALNPEACSGGECDGTPTRFGACADCHAPGIDGPLGGRDLRDAEGFARDYGVHCDVCHKVAALEPAGPPGVGGRLVVQRPSERSPSIALGVWKPLTFGPDHDVPNPRMGLVQRDHFREAAFCAGCHQYEQPGGGLDPVRWPEGRLPIHTTHEEWLASPKNPDTPCQSCHMPPSASAWNSADLQLFGEDAAGVAAGWRRPIGSVSGHGFVGPRQRESGLLEQAATLDIVKVVEGERVTARVTVANVLAGHAIPTGEPLRSLVLLVEARCGDVALAAIGGDAVPDFGGAHDRKGVGEDWSLWPGAEVGDALRVVARPGGYFEYQGFGPFSDGRFDAAAKGMPIERVVGEARVVAVDADGRVALDRPLPAGDVVYRGRGGGLPEDGTPATARAGASGFAFARVLVGADGSRMVPHFRAVDVASDNRLLPGRTWTSEHVFASTCEAPTVHAVLVHRAYPQALADERGWTLTESVMVRAVR